MLTELTVFLCFFVMPGNPVTIICNQYLFLLASGVGNVSAKNVFK